MQRLLWPAGPPSTLPDSDWAADLDLPVLVRAIEWDSRHSATVQQVLASLSTDIATIKARQAILADLLAAPALRETLAEQMVSLAALVASGRAQGWGDEAPLLEASRRIRELDLYVATVRALQQALAGASIHSAGLQALLAELNEVAADETFLRLEAELPSLQQPLEQLASVTIGVNLDDGLRPTSATLVTINDFRFDGRRDLLGRLFGAGGPAGLTPLRKIDPQAPNPFAAPLFRDLERLLADVTQSLIDGIARYSRVNVTMLAGLRAEFAFFLGAARLVDELTAAGLPLATPDLLPLDQRRTELHGLYDISLALRLREQGNATDLVLNDARLDVGGRLALLTGPNRGGKTTFTRAVGLAHVMAQAGLPVPARQAVLSPIDAIFTEFASGESHTVGFGRFDEEARRLTAIFDSATPASLLLLNEPLSGTSPDEALQLARGVVSAMQRLGARAILVTHLHALARDADAFTAEQPGEPVISLIASPVEPGTGDGSPNRSFRIIPGPPARHSRALEIAREHGLTPEQLADRLQARGF